MTKAIIKTIGVLSALWIGVTISAPAAMADTMFQADKWVDSLKFGGDMRLRHESLYIKGAGNGNNDQNRERIRLRYGATAAMQDFQAGFRIASGVGQQVSTNQTLANEFTEKQLWIDQAWISYKPHEDVKLIGGKMSNPLWRTYASDLVWDDDISPEGYAETVDVPMGDRLGLFANIGQFPLFEARATPDAWMLANQIGMRLKLSEDTRVTLAGTYYGFLNEKIADFSAANTNGANADGTTVAANDTVSVQQGNARNGGGRLATSLQLFHFTGELAVHALGLPVALQGDWLHNAMDTQSAGDDGYQTGVIIGKAKDKGSWETGIFYKFVQFNATMADLADSDFGNGGINRKGLILWLGYALRDNVMLKGKYFITSVINPYLQTNGLSSPTIQSATGTTGPINRFQLDLVAKF
jgi:hypothetical protein